MPPTRNIEIFSAGCPICEGIIQRVRALACSSCEVSVLDVNDPTVARRAATLDIRSVPAVAVDGALAACCAERGIDEDALRAAGLGQPIS